MRFKIGDIPRKPHLMRAWRPSCLYVYTVTNSAPLLFLQQFPVFQAPRFGDGVTRGEAVVPQAIAQEITAVPELDERLPAQNFNIAADAEEMLKEIDACGVSFTFLFLW